MAHFANFSAFERNNEEGGAASEGELQMEQKVNSNFC